MKENILFTTTDKCIKKRSVLVYIYIMIISIIIVYIIIKQQLPLFYIMTIVPLLIITKIIIKQFYEKIECYDLYFKIITDKSINIFYTELDNISISAQGSMYYIRFSYFKNKDSDFVTIKNLIDKKELIDVFNVIFNKRPDLYIINDIHCFDNWKQIDFLKKEFKDKIIKKRDIF